MASAEIGARAHLRYAAVLVGPLPAKPANLAEGHFSGRTGCQMAKENGRPKAPVEKLNFSSSRSHFGAGATRQLAATEVLPAVSLTKRSASPFS